MFTWFDRGKWKSAKSSANVVVAANEQQSYCKQVVKRGNEERKNSK